MPGAAIKINLILSTKKIGYAISLIFTHHRFSDALVENQICRFPRVDASFPWPREEWEGNMADIVSRDELAKTSWIALTNGTFSKR